MTHGTRRDYKAGCRCTPCKAAEARYRANLRWLHRVGKQPLGAKVSAVDTARRIRQLLIERMTKASIAKELGLKRPILELHTGPNARVTLRTALLIKRLHRLKMDPDAHA